MKSRASFSVWRRKAGVRSQRAFTLPELLIAIAIFLLLITGILAANLFGLRMFKLNETKLNATEWSRSTFGRFTDEIHNCQSMSVGYITNGVFMSLLDGERQEGTGLLIYPLANTNNFIVYFANAADQTFRRTTDRTNSAEILAESVTNALVFSARDLSGNVLSNNANNRVVHLQLEIYQAPRFLQDADCYKLETTVTRRVRDGQ